MAADAKTLKLKWPYLTIALLPILVYIGTDLFLHHYGDVADGPLPAFLPFDSHREAAGRLNLLGTFVLFFGVAAGAIAYFAVSVMLLSIRSRIVVIAYFIILMVVGAWIIAKLDTRQMQDYMGPAFVCAALGHAPVSGPDQAAVPAPATDWPCDNPRFLQLREILTAHKFATMLCVAAIVLGAICCLATPIGGATRKQALDYYESQSGRLNIYLYLSALFLVSDLFFAAAYARWPGYVLAPGSGFEVHANAFVAYLGFSYSLLIASFYVPVAAFLARNVRELKPDGKAEGLPDAFTGPLQILKIGSAIFSTALAGALPAILGLGT